MHLNDRSGVMTGTREDFARDCRCQVVEAASAIDELDRTKTADVTECNGVVTLVCRRMRMEWKKRNQSKLRVSKFRSNASVTQKKPPRAYGCGSNSGSVASEEKGDGEREVELPPRWPKTAEEAVRRKPVATKATDDQIRNYWLQGAARGGRDIGGNLIHNFWIYVDARVESDKGRAVERAANGNGHASASKTVYELESRKKNIEEKMIALRNQFTHESPTGVVWGDPERRKEYFNFKKEREEIVSKLAAGVTHG